MNTAIFIMLVSMTTVASCSQYYMNATCDTCLHTPCPDQLCVIYNGGSMKHHEQSCFDGDYS